MMDENVYAPPRTPVGPRPLDPETPAREASLKPLGTGVAAALMALLVHLMMPASDNIRRADREWPWLDPYRIGHPARSGWPTYLAYGLTVALAAGLLIGGTHRIAARSIGSPWARRLLAWGFMLGAVVVGAFAPPLLHRLPRLPVRPRPGVGAMVPPPTTDSPDRRLAIGPAAGRSRADPWEPRSSGWSG